jgi:undecaprenyl-diphosphatase
MPVFLQNIDLFLFQLFNMTLANPLFDKLMPFVTHQQNWNMVYIILLVWLLWKGGRNGRIAFVLLIITIICADQLSSSFIKSWVARPRPCHNLTTLRLLVDCGSGYSFPSSHAVNNFAAAVILSYFYKEYKVVLFTIASVVAFSRVYVGVHFPIDIVSGAFIGYIVAKLILLVYKRLADKYSSIALIQKIGSK